MVTLKDIAKKTDLSITTVSKVINYNDTSICSEETRKLILSCAESMGYKSRNKTKPRQPSRNDVYRMAYVMKAPTYELAGTNLYGMIRGIEEETMRREVLIPFSCLNLDLYVPEALADKMEEAGIQIVIWIAAASDSYFAALSRRGIRIVMAGGGMLSTPEEMDYIGVDEYGETLRWFKTEFMSRFHRIGYIGMPGQPQYEGYADAHKLLNRELDDRLLILLADNRIETARTAASRYVDGGTALPDLLFASCDSSAIGALHAFQDRGIAVPEQVKLVGFDNIEMSGYTTPGLTTIGVPAFEIGRHAVAAAVSLLRGERDYPVRHLFATRLIIRGSCPE